jgi:MFS family permease
MISPTRERRATTAAFLANGLGIGAWAGNLPRLKEAFGLSDALLGFVLLGFAGGTIAGMAVTGRIAGRLGAGRTTAAAGLAFAALLPLPSLAPGVAVLTAAVVVLGLATGAMDVSMNTHATIVERRWGAAIMSSFHAGWSLGGLAGSVLAGTLASMGRGLPAAMAVPACVVALLAAGALTLRDERAATPAASPFALPGRRLLGLATLAFLCMFGEGAMADWTGIYMRFVAGAPTALAAIGFAAFSLAMTAGRLGGDAVVRRAGPRAVVHAGGAVAAAGLLLALAFPAPAVAACGFGLVGLGLSNVVPVVFSAAARAGASSPGVGIAMAASLGYAGFLVGPPLIGLAASATNLRAALLLVVAGVTGVAAMAHLAGRRTSS